MNNKLLLLITLYGIMLLLAGDKIMVILFITSVPAITYVAIKLCLIEAPGNFISSLMYGENTVTKPVKALSHIHLLLVQERFDDALHQLNNMGENFIEVEKLKMKILYEHMKNDHEALKIGLGILRKFKPSLESIEVLGDCVEICIEANNFPYAQQLLNEYGPKMPSQNLVKDKYKRLDAIQCMKLC